MNTKSFIDQKKKNESNSTIQLNFLRLIKLALCNYFQNYVIFIYKIIITFILNHKEIYENNDRIG